MKKYEHIEHIVCTEPRIRLIKQQLESLLRVVDLESDGQVVKIDGFRLKDLSAWCSPIPIDFLSNLGSFSGGCNCKCVFCYERGFSKARPNLLFLCRRPMLTLEEVRMRALYYNAKSGTGLFTTLSDSMEPTLNPHWLDILRIAREKCLNEILDLPNTNGTHLTEEAIKQLAELKPIIVNISLHSANPIIRKELMRDPYPEIAIQSIPLLRRYGIQFRVGIVPWPTIPLKDVESTIRYVDHYDPLEIEIQLPGFTRFGFESPPFDTTRQWNAAIELIRLMRSEIQTPLYASPYMYEVQGDVSPIIVGVIKNSPAAHAGLRFGDRILEIDGKKVFTRAYCNDLLGETTEGDRLIKIRRNKKIKEVCLTISSLRDEEDLYPYKPKGYPVYKNLCYGILLPGSFRLGYMTKIDKLCKKHSARTVLILASKLIAPYLKKIMPMLTQNGYFKGVKVYIEVPENKFWGGNICLGDLLMIEDYANCIKKFLQERKIKPDLLVIPSSGLSIWGRDLSGRSFLDIERQFDIPVELLRCQIIWR